MFADVIVVDYTFTMSVNKESETKGNTCSD